MQRALRPLLSLLALAAPALAQQTFTQTVSVRTPDPSILTKTPLGPHLVTLGGSFPTNFSVQLPKFDPGRGELMGVTIRSRNFLSFDDTAWSTPSVAFINRNLSLTSGTSIQVVGPSFAEAMSETHAINDLIPAFRQSRTYAVPDQTVESGDVVVPAADVAQFVGTGTLLFDFQVTMQYGGSFPARNSTAMWRPSINAGISIDYEYRSLDDGFTERGLPGSGTTAMSFAPTSSGGCVLGAEGTWNPYFRQGEVLSFDQNGLAERDLPFAFPMPGGASIQRLRIHLRGCVSDAAIDPGLGVNPSPSQFRNSPVPILAPCWHNFTRGTSQNQAQNGRVWFTERPGEVVITWERLTEILQNTRSTFQLVLRPDGSFAFHYQRLEMNGNSVLVGISAGRNNGPRATIDVSSDILSGTTTVPSTASEFFPGASDLESDLGQPVLRTAQGRPVIGANDFEVEVTNTTTAFGIPVAQGATLLVGTPSSFRFGQLLPAPGLQESFLRVDLASLIDVPMSLTRPTTVPVPNSVDLIGAEVAMQSLVLDPQQATNVLGLMFSNELLVVIGD